MSKREGIMLCYPFEEKRLEKWGVPVIIQPKLDGLRCRAVYSHRESRWVLLSSEKNEIVSVPHINEGLRDAPQDKEFDGELYCHGLDFSKIMSIVHRSTSLHSGSAEIQFHVFDLVNELPQLARMRNLRSLADSMPPSIQYVKSVLGSGLDFVTREYEKILKEDYEGIIVRHFDGAYVRRRSTQVMKFKPKQSDWYPIIGYQEEKTQYGIPKGRLGALVCQNELEDEFNVGTGFTHEQRHDLWRIRDKLVGKICHVAYQHITSGRNVPRFPVFIEVLKPEGGLLDVQHEKNKL